MRSLALLAALATGLGGCGSSRGAPSTPPSEGHPCDRDNGGCDPNAKCIERGGTALCICRPWYSGDGLSCAATGLQTGAPWPVEGGNVRHTGQSIYEGPQSNHLKWSIPIEQHGIYFGGPVIDAEGTIFVGSYEVLHAFTPDASSRWTLSVPDAQWSTPAISSDGTLYVQAGGLPQSLYAVDTATDPTERIKWSSVTYDEGNSPNIGADGTVYAVSAGLVDGGNYGMCYAFDAGNSTPKATLKTAVMPEGSSLAIGLDGTLFLATADGLAAIDTSLNVRWLGPLSGGTNFLSPVIGNDGTVYIGDDEGFLYAFDPATGAVRSFQLANAVYSLAIAADGTLYVGTEKGLFAIDPTTIGQENEPLWLANPQPQGFGVGHTAIGSDGTIYAASDRLYAINPDGSVKWSSDVIGGSLSPLAIGADGTLYVMNGHTGVLYAFGP
jgi:outer membrane protein assembly factor BamB